MRKVKMKIILSILVILTLVSISPKTCYALTDAAAEKTCTNYKNTCKTLKEYGVKYATAAMNSNIRSNKTLQESYLTSARKCYTDIIANVDKMREYYRNTTLSKDTREKIAAMMATAKEYSTTVARAIESARTSLGITNADLNKYSNDDTTSDTSGGSSNTSTDAGSQYNYHKVDPSGGLLSGTTEDESTGNTLDTDITSETFLNNFDTSKDVTGAADTVATPFIDTIKALVGPILTILQVIGGVLMVISIAIVGFRKIANVSEGLNEDLFGGDSRAPREGIAFRNLLRGLLIGSVLLFASTTIVNIVFTVFTST